MSAAQSLTFVTSMPMVIFASLVRDMLLPIRLVVPAMGSGLDGIPLPAMLDIILMVGKIVVTREATSVDVERMVRRFKAG